MRKIILTGCVFLMMLGIVGCPAQEVTEFTVTDTDGNTYHVSFPTNIGAKELIAVKDMYSNGIIAQLGTVELMNQRASDSYTFIHKLVAILIVGCLGGLYGTLYFAYKLKKEEER